MAKRLDYLSWDEYFLSVAFLSGMRSKDPCTQVGACIVNKDKIIVSIGYNGMPRGCDDDQLPWGKQSENPLENKYMYVCHAETNAVLNKNSADVSGCTIYVALFPCNNCAKIIIQSRIKEVVFFSDKHRDKIETRASKRMLDMAGVFVRQFYPKFSKVEIYLFSPYQREKTTDDRKECPVDSVAEFSEQSLKNISIHNEELSSKRLNYITWEEYFMALVFLSSQRSKDPEIQLGACIVNNDNKIVGIGYNGMPRGCSDDALPWASDSCDPFENKDIYGCHAEMNAILNKNRSKISGCKMYVSTFPCNDCAKLIIQEEINEIIYFCNGREDFVDVKASKIMLDMVGIKYRCYKGRSTRFTVDFASIDWNNFK